MDFSLSRVYVSPVGNVLSTAGTTATLAPNQFSLFLPNFTPATAANVAAADYFFAAQGRNSDELNLRSIKSDRIYPGKIISKYKIVGSATATAKIVQVSDFVAKCGNQYSLTIRAFSNYINTSYYNGLTVPITVNGPCCDCGGDPCATLDGAAIQALVDEFVTKINDNKQLDGFIVASRTGTLDTSVLVLTGQVIAPEAQTCDLNANPYEYDAVDFNAFAQIDPATTQDYAIDDTCEQFATVTTTQEISFPRGIAAQVRKIEKEWFAYTVPAFKNFYSTPGFNGLFHSNVVDGTVYDQIVVRFDSSNNTLNYGDFSHTESTVIIFTPQAQTAAVEAIIEAAIGDLEDKSPA